MSKAILPEDPIDHSKNPPGRRARALFEWCEKNDYDPHVDTDPHIQAFLRGYDAGFEDGWDDGDEHATEYLRNGGTFR